MIFNSPSLWNRRGLAYILFNKRAGDEDATNMPPNLVGYSETAGVIPDITPEKEDYKFLGWASNPSGTPSIKYQPGDTVVFPKAEPGTLIATPLYTAFALNVVYVTLPTGTGYATTPAGQTKVTKGDDFSFVLTVDKDYTGDTPLVTYRQYSASGQPVGQTVTMTYTSKETQTDGSIKYGYTIQDVTLQTGVSITVYPAYQAVTLPQQVGNPVYTGNWVYPSWDNYSSQALTLTGDWYGKNAGSYTAVFTPKEGYAWADNGGQEARNAPWTIGKAAGVITLDKTSVTILPSAATVQIRATRLSSGGLTAESSAENIAKIQNISTTPGTNNAVAYIDVQGQKTGSAKITITAEEDENTYEATAECEVTVDYQVTVTITARTGTITGDPYVMCDGVKHNAVGSFKAEYGKAMLCHPNETGVAASYVTVDGVTKATNAEYTYMLTGDVDVAISGTFDWSTYFSTNTIAITTK